MSLNSNDNEDGKHSTTSKAIPSVEDQPNPQSPPTDLTEPPRSSSQEQRFCSQALISLEEDSESELSAARSDISDISDEEENNTSPSSDAETKLRYSSSDNSPKTLPGVSSKPRQGSSIGGRPKVPKLPERSQTQSSIQWLSSQHHHIPVQDSAWSIQHEFGTLNPDEQHILVHLTFQKDSDGVFFHPCVSTLRKTDPELHAAEQFILSHCSVFSGYRSRNSRRLGLIEPLFGFSAVLSQSLTEQKFEVLVQQLLRSYFLHPSAEKLQFQVEFRVIYGNKEGTAQSFSDSRKSLFDFHKGHKDVHSLSAVITKIVVPEPTKDVRRDACNSTVKDSEYIQWIHWVRVGNGNEHIDKIPACIARLAYDDGRKKMPFPFRKDRAVLFGVGI